MKAKKIIVSLTALTLTAGLAIGGTLAYFNATTEEKVNAFTASPGFGEGENLLISLEEPSWTGDKEGFQPGDLFAKDPMIANNSTVNAFVGIKLVYSVDGTVVPKSIFDNQATIQSRIGGILVDGFRTADWTVIEYDNETDITTDDYSVAYYNNILAAGSETSKLFNKVLIPIDLDETNIESFDIELKGYAVQSQNNGNSAQAALEAQFDFK